MSLTVSEGPYQITSVPIGSGLVQEKTLGSHMCTHPSLESPPHLPFLHVAELSG